jgi:hypothetical protein
MAADDALKELQVASDKQATSAGTSKAPAPDPLAALRERLAALEAAGDKFKQRPTESAL